MRTQPELLPCKDSGGKIISCVGRAAHRSKLDNNSGLSLILCFLQKNTVGLCARQACAI